MAPILRFLCFVNLVALTSARDEAVVFVVDPSWDCVESYVANVPLLQEYKIIKVMTRLGKAPKCNSDTADIYQNITYNSSEPNDVVAAEEICPILQSGGIPIAAVIATFDPAVPLADRLAACVGARGNDVDGPTGSQARHDKYFINEAVRKAGLRSIDEKLVSNWPDAKDYLESLSPPLSEADPVILKILQGSSSEGVQKVTNMKQAEEIITTELNSTSHFGKKIDHVLIQEYLKGEEYVIDSASRDGVHKVIMVWDEDLRPGNGIPNLYFGFKAMDPEDQKTIAIIDYANKVLTATGVRNGASDMEVKWLEEEGRPCLVDLNARWTALMFTDGLALEKALVGNEQITATINAYLDGAAFDKIPLVPAMEQHGAVIFTNVWHTGILRGIPGMTVAKKLPSYFGNYNDRAVVGKKIEKYTAGNPPITLLLAHTDEAVLDADYDRIIDLEYEDAFWDIEPLQSDSRPAIAAAVALTVPAMLAAVGCIAILRGTPQDGTEYLSIE